MQDNWVDFKTIKSAVTMQMVLDRYGINWLRKNGEEVRGRCPIHQGQGAEAFHANLERSVFHCFACGAGGNVLDFIAGMEGCSIREAALRLQGSAGDGRRRTTRSKIRPGLLLVLTTAPRGPAAGSPFPTPSRTR